MHIRYCRRAVGEHQRRDDVGQPGDDCQPHFVLGAVVGGECAQQPLQAAQQDALGDPVHQKCDQDQHSGYDCAVGPWVGLQGFL